MTIDNVRLQIELAKLPMSQADFCQEIGITPSTLSRILNTGKASYRAVKAISGGLKLSVMELIRR